MGWSVVDIPSQRGRTAVVTGPGGLGFETGLALARAGARVVMAGRNPAKGAEAVAQIRSQAPQSNVEFAVLDLASLASVADFAGRFAETHGELDLLVNNAGVMAPPERHATSDGFEMQFGTNYLGHFALTARLLPLLRQGDGARVVNVSSLAHRGGKIAFDDLQAERSYAPYRSYSQSKFAQVLHTLEFQRRSAAGGWGVLAVAAHPGFSSTELIANGPGARSGINWIMGLVGPLLWQSAAEGALPSLYAATAPEAEAGGFYGPAGFMEMKGPPKRAQIDPGAKDPKLAARLWETSEALTGVKLG
jgi:NAD(P)-dependent dehydrogenase (short-subunit alcohol dehydrogenase family)